VRLGKITLVAAGDPVVHAEDPVLAKAGRLF
jgi:hypothetical protein